jgi:DNA-binding IscR family transcriptional regulator
VLLTVWSDVGRHMRELLDTFTLADMVTRAQGGAPAVDVPPLVTPVA